MATIAINDIKEIDKSTGKIFKQCTVFVRKGFDPIDRKKVNLSQLSNIKISKDKNGIVCFCDGYKIFSETVEKFPIDYINISQISASEAIHDSFIEKIKEDVVAVMQSGTFLLKNGEVLDFNNPPTPIENNLETFQENKEAPYDVNEYISLEEVTHRSLIQDYDHDEEAQRVYEADKLWWVLKFSNDKRLKLAVKQHYACNEEYVLARINDDFPGFSLANHSTYILAAKYPSYEGMVVEQYFQRKLEENKKYKMRTRLGYLDEHDNLKLETPIEILIIFNYLNNYEIYCDVKNLTEMCLVNMEHDLDE